MSGKWKNPPDARLMSATAAAEELRYHPVYVGTLMREGKIKGHKIGNKWYTTAEAVEEFRLKHSKNKHYSLDELHEKNKKEAKVKKMANTKGLPWQETDYLNPRNTEEYLRGVPRRGGHAYGEITLNMACELETVKPGASKRFFCKDVEDAKRIQSYIRDAAYLAGWYDGIPQDDRRNWTMWQSHVSRGTDNGIPPHLLVVRLKEKRESKAVSIRKNRLEKLQKEMPSVSD